MEKAYRYVGPRSIVDLAPTSPAGAPISSVDGLIQWVRDALRIERRGSDLTATYVVDADGVLRLADRHSEHVACAGGGPVRAAGEMTFSVEREGVSVTDVTNLSTGYCPEPESWPAVAAALATAGVRPPAGYTTAFDFRRCPSCRATNVVKDGVFECAVCGKALPSDWNLND